MSEEWLGCGVATHDEDCLCDVVITNPLPPLEECITDAVQEMWMGSKLCEIKGYAYPWNDEQILNYLTDMEKFYDAFHEMQEKPVEINHISEMPVFDESIEELPTFIRWSRIRDSVQYCMDRFDNSLCDIMLTLNLSPQQVIDALTTGKGGDNWNIEMLEKLDLKFMSDNLNIAEVGREMNLTKGVVRGLSKYWDARRTRTQRPTNSAREKMHWLCRNTDLPPREIIDIVHKEHGVLYARSSVSKTRKRIIRNNNTM